MKVCSLCKANESLPSHTYCKRCLRDYTRNHRKTYVPPPGVLMKRRARHAATKALARGTLVRQPCEVCANPVAEMHHDDYAKRFVVRWLCKAHHHLEHNQRWHGETPVEISV